MENGIGNRIKEARLNLHLTQEELAKRIGVTKGAIANYEKNTSHPKESVIYSLIETLEVDANFLFQDCVKTKKVPEITPEALKLAKDFDSLDSWGKESIRIHTDSELKRCVEQAKEKIGMEASDDFTPALILLPRSGQPASAGTGMFLGPDDFETIYVKDTPLIRRATFAVPVSGDSMEPDYHDGDTLLVESMNDIRIGEIGVFTIDGMGYVKKRGKNSLISLNPEYDPIPFSENTRCNGKVIGILDPSWIVER